MSLLRRLMGREEPKVRTRICVECSMPIAEHKDWCAILQGENERKAGSEAAAS